jgi:putative transposase
MSMKLKSRPYLRAKERAAKRYSTDLSDAEWEVIRPLMPPPKVRGSKRKVEFREVLNAIFYQIHNGCIWSDIPKDLPAHQTVYSYFSKWQRRRIWTQIHDALRTQVCESVGKLPDQVRVVVNANCSE